MQPEASIVITTKNRKEDLKIAVASALKQTANVEVIVIDDGSTDGSASMIAAEFPSVILHRVEESAGYIVQRNFAARLARAPIIFSIDDDAAFPSPTTVEETLREFEHERIGAVAIPFVNVKYNDAIRQKAPSTNKIFLTASYIGTAHAVRKDLFLRLGGYRELLVHQGEEEDFCVRMLEAGYFVRLGNASPIHHFESPLRDLTRLHMQGPRNLILFSWCNVPAPQLYLHLPAVTLNVIRHGVRIKRPLLKLKGLMRGYLFCFQQPAARRPVRLSTYRMFRQLKRAGTALLDDLLARVPNPQLT